MRNWIISIGSLTLITLLVMSSGCNRYTMKSDFQEDTVPEPPDYTSVQYWAALPQFEDAADTVPDPMYVDRQDIALVDVFFVHPTTWNDREQWNGSLVSDELNTKTDTRPIRHQASLFNGQCRVFAPRYRQMAYQGFFTDGISQKKSGVIAYQDVAQSFQYYLDHYNEGRPFIIAGHSQGAFHAAKLLEDFIDTTDLFQQLVAAYIPGWPIEPDRYHRITVCEEPGSNQCFVSWNTFRKDYLPRNHATFYANATNSNPLSWKEGDGYVNAEHNMGLVAHKFDQIFPGNFGAQSHEGVLWVDPVRVKGIPFTGRIRNWHVGDMNLFYANIRQNIAERCHHFFWTLKNEERTNQVIEDLAHQAASLETIMGLLGKPDHQDLDGPTAILDYSFKDHPDLSYRLVLDTANYTLQNWHDNR